MLVIKAGIHKMLFRIANRGNRGDPDQTASSAGSELFVEAFWQAASARNFRT